MQLFATYFSHQAFCFISQSTAALTLPPHPPPLAPTPTPTPTPTPAPIYRQYIYQREVYSSSSTMEPEFSAGGRPSPNLQGPRPTPLKVNKDSYKIKKPPVAPQLQHPHQLPPPAAPLQPDASGQNRQTVVIYTVSPKVIHTTVNEFMSLVQRLTGPSPRAGETSTAARGAGDVSPAARLASLEKVSPSDRERERDLRGTNSADNILEILEGTDAEISQIPGILTPEPTTLLPISPPGLFSPAMDPFLHGNNMFITSPSFLFSSPIISPNPFPDLFNPFFDFQ